MKITKTTNSNNLFQYLTQISNEENFSEHLNPQLRESEEREKLMNLVHIRKKFIQDFLN